MKQYHILINKALAADRRAKTLQARLQKFPLWKRLVFWTRFSKIRALILKYTNSRAALTAAAMITVRVTKKRKRK